MRGHLRQRSKGSWSIVLDMGRTIEADTGRLKRSQKWITIQGTKREADAKLAEILHRMNRGQIVEPSKMTLAYWLKDWLESVIKPSRRLRTYETYSHVVNKHLVPNMGQIRLCDLRASHLQQYYNNSTLSKATLQQHHAIMHGALQASAKQDLVLRNVAELVEGKPRIDGIQKDAMLHCWDEEEARQFVDTAKHAGTQEAAFYKLALDSGARKGELCGLRWDDVDWDAGTISIVRQLVKVQKGAIPVFGPPKNGTPRSISLAPQTIGLLKKHKVTQAEHRLATGTVYCDHGLVFTREWGQPLQMNNLGEREYKSLIERSKVRRIKFHGLRHTCATLLLKKGKPIHVVADRLGHKDPTITMKIYAHALPSMQKEAAAIMEAVLHG